MRIIVRGHPEFGHLYPLMPLACAAREAGHEVVFPTTAPFTDRLTTLGFRTVHAGIHLNDAIRARFGDGRPPTIGADGDTAWDVIGEIFADAATAIAADLRQLLPELGADLVIYDNTDLGAGAAAAATGVDSVAVAITRALPPAAQEAFHRPSLRQLEATLGWLPRPHDPVLDSYPPSLQRPEFLTDPRRTPVRPVPWAEPMLPLPAWVGTRERSLIFVTFGTVIDPVASMRVVLDGLAALEADILIAAGRADPTSLGRLPDNIHILPLVHQANLLPHVDVVVHHGGCGTTTSAWGHGVPQLVLPNGADRFINADAVTTSGTGIALRDPTPKEIERSARLLLEAPSYRRSAATIRDEISTLPHPASVLADLLPASAARQRAAP
jgi:UDP:flavonoid glycosyltransferase YjiC (YdhE family)